jgi:hypothetical protein
MNTTSEMKRAAWRGVDIKERQRYAKDVMFVAHPKAAALLSAIIQRRQLHAGANVGRGILITAPPDGGKTRFIKYLATLIPDLTIRTPEFPDPSEPFEDRTVKEFVHQTVPSPCSLLTCANGVLQSIGHPSWEGLKTSYQVRLAKSQLGIAGTKLFAVDNVQDIPEQKGPLGTSRVGNFYRDLIEESRMIVLFFGTDEAEIVVTANKQLRKRVPGKLQLGGYDVSTVDGMALVLRVLDMIDDAFPLAKKSGLGVGRLGKALACASDGKVGAIVDILISSLPFAFADGREHLTMKDVESGYTAQYLDYAAAANPFANDFQYRRLIRPGEPHFTAVDDDNTRRRKRKPSAA